MLSTMSPSDFVVSASFRWRGIVYTKGSGLPGDIPQGMIRKFLHKDPPLIKAKPAKKRASAPKKKAAKKKASKKTSKRG